MATDESANVPHAQKAGWASFLKSIASFSGDLSSLTAPPFILSPVSLAEFPSYWGEPTGAFAAIADGKTPEERHLLVTQWVLATFAGQFTRREKETGSEKKPLNPILGEQFLGKWEGPEGDTVLRAEQVSHHPPVTAYSLENQSKGLSFEGNCAQKTAFSGRTIVVKQVGHAMLRVNLPDGSVEKYLITLPKLKIEGLWYAAPYVELADQSYIQASHGLTSCISYTGKGYFSGKSHSFTCQIGVGPPSPSIAPLYVIEGVWTGESKYTKPASKAGQLFLNAGTERVPIQTAEIDAMGEFESRKIWKDTAEAIRKGDFEFASKAKTLIETSERQKRKDEQAEGAAFKLRLFTLVEESPDYRMLAKLAGHQPAIENAYRYNGRAE